VDLGCAWRKPRVAATVANLEKATTMDGCRTADLEKAAATDGGGAVDLEKAARFGGVSEICGGRSEEGSKI